MPITRTVLVTLCFVTNDSQTRQLRNNKHQLPHGFWTARLQGQLPESRGSGSLTSLEPRRLLGLLSFLTRVAAGEILPLTGCWTLGLGSSRAVGWGRPSGLGYMGFSTGQLTTWQLAFLRAREGARDVSIMEAGVFWKHELRVTPHQVCLVLLSEASHCVQSTTLKGTASHEA